MVRNTDLKYSNKNALSKQAKDSLKKTDKYEKIPVYPSKIQTTAFPERAYIFAIEKLVLISIVLFAFSVVLGISIYYKTFLFKPSPLFIYYSDTENQFKVKEPFDGYNTKKIHYNIQIMAEDFLQNWIKKYYSISESDDVNQNNWCNCMEIDANGNQKNLGANDCYVCRVSDPAIYSVFSEFVAPVLGARKKQGIVRLVKIIDMEKIYHGYINHNQAKTSVLENMTVNAISSFMNPLYSDSSKISLFKSNIFYLKTDFVVADFKDGKIINKEFFTSYNTVGLQLFQDGNGKMGVNKNWGQNFKLMEHSVNFILHDKYKNTDFGDLENQYKMGNSFIKNNDEIDEVVNTIDVLVGDSVNTVAENPAVEIKQIIEKKEVKENAKSVKTATKKNVLKTKDKPKTTVKTKSNSNNKKNQTR